MTSPDTKTFAYAPQVRVLIRTKDGVIDLSKDVVSGNVRRVVDECSTFTINFGNKNDKYTGKIARGDTITIELKRVQWVQVFSGYVSSVPFRTLFSTTSTISGECTLKRLRDTWWDPGVPENKALLMGSPNQDDPDAGLGDSLIKLLVEGGDWDKDKIHVQSLPDNILDLVKKYFVDAGDISAIEQEIMRLLGWDGVIGGESIYSGADVGSAATTDDAKANARVIIRVAKQLGFSEKGIIIALITAMQESGLGTNKATRSINSEGDAGIFQQRVRYRDGAYYGTLEQVNDVAWATKTFLIGVDTHAGHMPGLKDIKGWETMPYWQAAAKVQRPAKRYETYYDKHVPRAQALLKELSGTESGGGGDPSSTPPKTVVADKNGMTKETFIMPINGSSISTKFGVRGRNWSKYHTGVDVKGSEGTDIVATASGTVRYIRMNDGSWGNRVVLEHGKVFSVYCHCSRILVSNNQKVAKGQVIAKVGSTGNVTGPHLHFEIWNRFNPSGYASHEVNPENYIGKQIDVNAIVPDAGGVPGDSGAGDVGTAADPAGTMMYNWLFKNPVNDFLSATLAGERALINDVSFLASVREFVQAGMRRFMSAPNGDFVAFYPDYFGQNGTAPTLRLEDVEMKEFKVDLTDKPLATHVYAIGDTTGDMKVDYLDMLSSSGVVTLEQPWVLKALTNGDIEGMSDPNEILQKFGARPVINNYKNVRHKLFEFTLALQNFQVQWSKQFQTRVQFTFMPELYPGMRIEIANHDLVVYVESVVHEFSRRDGFNTSADINSPVSLGKRNDGMGVNG